MRGCWIATVAIAAREAHSAATKQEGSGRIECIGGEAIKTRVSVNAFCVGRTADLRLQLFERHLRIEIRQIERHAAGADEKAL